MNIIDNPIELSKLSRDEIDDILLQVKYNKANLRELIRNSVLTIRSKNKEIEYYKEV